MAKTELHIGRPPMGSDEELLAWTLALYGKLTGRVATPEEIEECRQITATDSKARALAKKSSR